MENSRVLFLARIFPVLKDFDEYLVAFNQELRKMGTNLFWGYNGKNGREGGRKEI